MADNILKKQLECISEDFLRGESVKQEFALEKARVRTFRSLENSLAMQQQVDCGGMRR